MARTADYGLGEFTYPRGWFMIAASDDLTDKPQGVRYFGRDFALYRGQSGRVILLDAYCPHMGTHLAINTTSYVVRDRRHVEGDSIRCPYHGWRFGPDGKVDDIPYFDGPIPKAACVRSWRVDERYGCIWVWHDPENGEPDYDLPDIPMWSDPAWVHWSIDRLGTLACHQQEVVDNIADYSHLAPIHGSRVDYFENEFKGHVAQQRQGGGHRTLTDEGGFFSTDTWYTGPAILLSHLVGHFETLMLITHTPVEDGVIKVWHGLLVKSPHAIATDADIAMARGFQESARLAFAQDFEVWAHKTPALKIMQLPTDGPFAKARLWYRQFYNPRAKARDFQTRVEGIHRIPGLPGAPRQQAAE